MQTFLPLPDFWQSAQVLDDDRLGKQRSETQIIWKTLTGVYLREGRRGWPHHPATRMWVGYETALLHYGIAVCFEWRQRGKRDETKSWFLERLDWTKPLVMPPWFGNEDFHRSHRSNLLRKRPDWYRAFWPHERDDLPYVWPEPEEVSDE